MLWQFIKLHTYQLLHCLMVVTIFLLRYVCCTSVKLYLFYYIVVATIGAVWKNHFMARQWPTVKTVNQSFCQKAKHETMLCCCVGSLCTNCCSLHTRMHVLICFIHTPTSLSMLNFIIILSTNWYSQDMIFAVPVTIYQAYKYIVLHIVE